MGQEEKLDIKFVIDKKKNRVVYAEVDTYFVDALFSFFTLPLGIIVELLDKNSGIGCIDKFYESIEKIDIRYFQTKACKNMILSPNSQSDVLCHNMKLRYNEKWKVKFYICPSWDCVVNKSPALLSLVPNSQCTCGKIMTGKTSYGNLCMKEEVANAVFLKDDLFIVTDDLRVMQSSHNNLLDLLNMLGISDINTLKEKRLKFGKNEILKLLRASFASKTPLTDTFLDKEKLRKYTFNCRELLFSLKHKNIFSTGGEDATKCRKINSKFSNYESFIDSQKVVNPMEMTVSLIRNKLTKEVIYVIGGGNFVDVLFSFLTFPLGSIIKLLGEKSLNGVGRIILLYGSLLDLVNYTDCIRSDIDISFVTEPKVASYFGSDHQLLKIEEHVKLYDVTINHIGKYLSSYPESKGKFVPDQIKAHYINPKSLDSRSDVGGAYVKRESKFIVTNKFEVLPFTAMSDLDVIKTSKIKVDDIEEEQITITEAQVLKLLQECLISKNILTAAFSK